MPKALDSEHERMREKLQTQHGKAFDDQYVRDMVEDHNKAVELFRQEERSGQHPELKQFAQKALPTLEGIRKWRWSCHTGSRRPPPGSRPFRPQLARPRPRIFSNSG
jgi:predicted outer membrane protein